MLPAHNSDIRWLLRSVCACLSWHQDGTLCLLQVSPQGMEQHSRPRGDEGAHRSKPWSDTEKAQEKTATITNTKNAAPIYCIDGDTMISSVISVDSVVSKSCHCITIALA